MVLFFNINITLHKYFICLPNVTILTSSEIFQINTSCQRCLTDKNIWGSLHYINKQTSINMKTAVTWHTQSLPGLKYYCPDFQNQQLIRVTGCDDDSVSQLLITSNLFNYLFPTWSNSLRVTFWLHNLDYM